MCGSSVLVHLSMHRSHSFLALVTGWNTTNLTATNDLFRAHPHIDFWRFEVIYTSTSTKSLGAVHFQLTRLAENGSCSVQPANGTTSTVFTIVCTQWQDDDGIQDYTVYSECREPSLRAQRTAALLAGRVNGTSERVLVGYSPMSVAEMRLSGGEANGSLVHLSVHVRDRLSCVTEYNLSMAVHVMPDEDTIASFVQSVQPQQQSTNNSISTLLASGSVNTVTQVITMLSREFNRLGSEAVDDAVASEYQQERGGCTRMSDRLMCFRWCACIDDRSVNSRQRLALSHQCGAGTWVDECFGLGCLPTTAEHTCSGARPSCRVRCAHRRSHCIEHQAASVLARSTHPVDQPAHSHHYSETPLLSVSLSLSHIRLWLMIADDRFANVSAAG